MMFKKLIHGLKHFIFQIFISIFIINNSLRDWLRALLFLQRTWVSYQHVQGYSQQSVGLQFQGIITLASSDTAHMWCSCTYAHKTLMHIK